MLGLSVGRPIFLRLVCQRRLRARPPSMQASLLPMVLVPRGCSPSASLLGSGACHRSASMRVHLHWATGECCWPRPAWHCSLGDKRAGGQPAWQHLQGASLWWFWPRHWGDAGQSQVSQHTAMPVGKQATGVSACTAYPNEAACQQARHCSFHYSLRITIQQRPDSRASC